MAYNVKPYNSYTSQFKNPYNFNGRVNSDVSSLLTNAWMNAEQEEKEQLKGRSGLDRIFDLLLTPVYASAGFADGVVQQFKGTNESPWVAWQQAGKGLLAGLNYFGDGDESSEYTYGKVLETAGWQPESTAGKIAKGTVGFTLDVLLDPTTYLSGGASAVIKGTGRTGKVVERLAKTAEEAGELTFKNTYERLVGQGVNPDLATRFATKKASENTSKFKNATHMTEDMASEIIQRQNFDRGVRMSTEELARDSKKFSDEYNRLAGIRDVNGGKAITLGVENLPFGQYLAPKMGVLGKTIQISDGATARAFADRIGTTTAYSKLRESIYGRKIGELFSTTSPLHRLYKKDPSELYSFVKFLETTKGLNADKITKEKAIRDQAKAMNFSPDEQKEIIKLMEDKTVWSKVRNHLNFSETAKANELNSAIRNALGKAEDEVDNLMSMKNNADSMRYASEQDLVANKGLYRQMEAEFRDEMIKLDLNLVRDKEQKTKIVEAMRDEVRKLDDEYSTLQRNNGVTPKEIDDLVKLADAEDLKRTEFFKTQRTGDEVFEAPTREANVNLINKISQYVYGKEGKLIRSLRGDTLGNLVHKIKHGESPDDVAKFIEENAHLYSEHATEVYKYLAQKYNYKSWKEAYHEPIKVLEDAIKKNGDLTPKEYQEYLRLKELQARRRSDFEKLFNHKTYDEFKDFRREEVNAKLIKELNDEIDLDLEKRRRTFGESGSTARNAGGSQPSEIIGELKRNGKIYQAFNIQTSTGKKKRYLDSESGMVYRLDKGKLVETSAKEYIPPVHGSSSVLGNEARSEMFTDAMVNFMNVENKNAMKNGRSAFLTKDTPLSQNAINSIIRITDEMEALLKAGEFGGREYGKLSNGQKQYLMKMALNKGKGTLKELDVKQQEALVKEVERRASVARVQAVVDTVKPGMAVSFHDGKRAREMVVESIKETEDGTKYLVKLGDETKEVFARDVKYVRTMNKQMMTGKDLVEGSKLAQSVIKEKETLANQLTKELDELSKLDGKYTEDRKQLFEFFKVRADEQRKVISDLEDTYKRFDDAYKAIVDSGEAEKLYGKIRQYEDALMNGDALEAFVKMHRGEKYVDDVLRDANITHSARIALDDLTESEKVKKWTEFLYEEFKRMGAKEVSIGKLKKDQFDSMVGRYLPHILTPDGRRYIDGLKELEPHKASITQDLGYGTKWNPYAQSRTIEGKSLDEINEHFRSALQGKNLFSDNVADIYITRALKHNELVYDNEYMLTMMQTFGKDIGANGVEQGYKAVANYGQLKETVAKLVRAKIDGGTVPGSKELWDTYTREVISDLGLPKGILDDIATPMVELTQEQVAKLAPHGIAKQVNSAIVQKANQARKLAIAKDQSRFLQVYDKFLHWMKLMQTTVMPSFHIRNKASNIFNNWLGVGKDATNPQMQMDSWRTVWHQGDIERLRELKPLVSDDGTKVFHWNELYELAKTHNVIDEGFFAKDVGANAGSKGLLKRIPSKYDPTDTENFKMFEVGKNWGTRIENSDRLIHFASLLKQGRSIDDAAASSKKFLFDYSDLTAFEMTWMKRIFPYYTWLRKNGRLQVSQVAEQPGKFRDVAKVEEAINSMPNADERVEDQYLSDFARDWVQTPFFGRNEEGSKEPIMMNPNMPFMDLGRLPDVLDPLNSARELLAQTSPQLKVPLELLTNKNFFFNNDIVKEGDNPVTPRLAHIARQLALYNAGEGFFKKEGIDSGLHTLNTFTGVKGLSYDYETSKNMRIAEMIKGMEEKRSALRE